MDILLIGYSSLARRRLLPALDQVEDITAVHIASRKTSEAARAATGKVGRTIEGYARALDELRPALVYVSLPNSLHHTWCRAALLAGAHVIVDKPAFLDARQAADIAYLAHTRGLSCAEASAWHFHPMLDVAANLIREDGRRPVAATAFFTSPAMEESNFRMDASMGGGIVYDRASYAITCGRLLYEGEPTAVSCEVTEVSPRGVDLSCRITMTYPGGGMLAGVYSLKADYRNYLSVLGETYSVDFDRVFTPPDDYEGPVVVRRRGAPESVSTPRANAFARFFEHVLNAIAGGTAGALTERMLRDASIMDRIRASASGGGAIQ